MPPDTPDAPLLVRPAVPGDAERIAHIRIDTWRDAYRGLMPATVLREMDHGRATRFFHTVIETGDGGHRLLSGFHGGSLDGFALWNRHDEAPEETAELRALYVLPGRQRSGLGAALLQRCRADMAAAGFAAMAVFCLESNLPAQRFYRKMGGAPLPYTRSFTVGGVSLPEIGFSLALVRDGEHPNGAPISKGH